jgi:ABC-type multidrug transport system ATPase subunit
VSKSYGARRVLRGVDLEVGPGVTVALVGENGSGKTTLLRLCAAMLDPDAGEIWLDGRRISADRRRAPGSIGAMLAPQQTWYQRLSGRHNLEFFATMMGMGPREARLAAGQELLDAGLANDAELPVAAYSSGMRARLALARARLGEPSLIVLDEPSSGLDETSLQSLVDQLGSAHGRSGVLVATHDRELAAKVADSILLLSDGRLSSAERAAA